METYKLKLSIVFYDHRQFFSKVLLEFALDTEYFKKVLFAIL